MGLKLPAAVDVEAEMSEFTKHRETAKRDEANSHSVGLKIVGAMAAMGAIGALIDDRPWATVMCIFVAVIACGVHFEDRRRMDNAARRDREEEEKANEPTAVEQEAAMLIEQYGDEAPVIARREADTAWEKKQFLDALRLRAAARAAEQQLASRAERP